jgi:hypothetical protein
MNGPGGDNYKGTPHNKKLTGPNANYEITLEDLIREAL